MINFTIKNNGVRQLVNYSQYLTKKFGQIPNSIVPKLVLIAIREVKLAYAEKGIKRPTGTAIRSISGGVIERTGSRTGNQICVGIVGSNEKHVAWLELGTKPHWIVAVRKPLLKFKINGRWYSKKKVFHTGTKGFGFFKLGMERMMEQIPALIKRESLK